MWIKFELNFMCLKLMDEFNKIIAKLHSFLGHRGFYGAANCIYILYVKKLNPLFKKQLNKCLMLLDNMKNI